MTEHPIKNEIIKMLAGAYSTAPELVKKDVEAAGIDDFLQALDTLGY